MSGNEQEAKRGGFRRKRETPPVVIREWTTGDRLVAPQWESIKEEDYAPEDRQGFKRLMKKKREA